MDKNALGTERRIAVSHTVDLPRPTVQGLQEAIQQAFAGGVRPTRILYVKGEESLVVESMVPQSLAGEADSPFLTPYEMVRQHCEIEILESLGPVKGVFKATELLAEKKYAATMIVVSSEKALKKWFTHGNLEQILRLPVLEDPDCPDEFVIFCGSQTGELMSHIEYAVICRRE